jgi:hypothetical protein
MKSIIERVVSVTSCCFMLLLYGPTLLFLSLVLDLADGQPLLIVQDWTDRHGRSIPLLALRMLCSERNIQAERLWKPWFRLILRGSGLDPLARLFNILRGDRDFGAFREGWEVDVQWFPLTEDTAPDPLDEEHPNRASVDEFFMWDDEIDGLRMPQIGIDDSERTDELGNDVFVHALLLLRSRKRMREGLRQFLRWYLGPRGPREPQRPMPA